MKTEQDTITEEIDNICKHVGDWTYFSLEETLHRLLQTQRIALIEQIRMKKLRASRYVFKSEAIQQTKEKMLKELKGYNQAVDELNDKLNALRKEV